MNFKDIWKTKTFWVGVLTVAAGIIEGVFDGWGQGYEKILLGLAIITGRHAVGKVQAQ